MSRLFTLVLILGITSSSISCDWWSQKNKNQAKSNSGSQPTRYGSATNKVVFCLFDLSASTEASATRQKYADTFKRIGEKISDGDVVVADAITDNPLSQSSFPVNESFPNFEPGTDNELLVKKKREEFDNQLKQRRERISNTVSALLSDHSRKINRTKILDAMQLAERVFRTYNQPRKVLVIFSDMIEESDNYNFQRQRLSQAESQRIIEAEKKAGRLPDLSGARVYVIGSAVGGQGSSQLYQNMESFWLQYFKAAGADLTKERYGAALLSFDE